MRDIRHSFRLVAALLLLICFTPSSLCQFPVYQFQNPGVIATARQFGIVVDLMEGGEFGLVVASSTDPNLLSWYIYNFGTQTLSIYDNLFSPNGNPNRVYGCMSASGTMFALGKSPSPLDNGTRIYIYSYNPGTGAVLYQGFLDVNLAPGSSTATFSMTCKSRDIVISGAVGVFSPQWPGYVGAVVYYKENSPGSFTYTRFPNSPAYYRMWEVQTTGPSFDITSQVPYMKIAQTIDGTAIAYLTMSTSGGPSSLLVRILSTNQIYTFLSISYNVVYNQKPVLAMSNQCTETIYCYTIVLVYAASEDGTFPVVDVLDFPNGLTGTPVLSTFILSGLNTPLTTIVNLCPNGLGMVIGIGATGNTPAQSLVFTRPCKDQSNVQCKFTRTATYLVENYIPNTGYAFGPTSQNWIDPNRQYTYISSPNSFIVPGANLGLVFKYSNASVTPSVQICPANPVVQTPRMTYLTSLGQATNGFGYTYYAGVCSVSSTGSTVVCMGRVNGTGNLFATVDKRITIGNYIRQLPETSLDGLFPVVSNYPFNGNLPRAKAVSRQSANGEILVIGGVTTVTTITVLQFNNVTGNYSRIQQLPFGPVNVVGSFDLTRDGLTLAIVVDGTLRIFRFSGTDPLQTGGQFIEIQPPIQPFDVARPFIAVSIAAWGRVIVAMENTVAPTQFASIYTANASGIYSFSYRHNQSLSAVYTEVKMCGNGTTFYWFGGSGPRPLVSYKSSSIVWNGPYHFQIGGNNTLNPVLTTRTGALWCDDFATTLAIIDSTTESKRYTMYTSDLTNLVVTPFAIQPPAPWDSQSLGYTFFGIDNLYSFSADCTTLATGYLIVSGSQANANGQGAIYATNRTCTTAPALAPFTPPSLPPTTAPIVPPPVLPPVMPPTTPSISYLTALTAPDTPGIDFFAGAVTQGLLSKGIAAVGRETVTNRSVIVVYEYTQEGEYLARFPIPIYGQVPVPILTSFAIETTRPIMSDNLDRLCLVPGSTSIPMECWVFNHTSQEYVSSQNITLTDQISDPSDLISQGAVDMDLEGLTITFVYQNFTVYRLTSTNTSDMSAIYVVNQYIEGIDFASPSFDTTSLQLCSISWYSRIVILSDKLNHVYIFNVTTDPDNRGYYTFMTMIVNDNLMTYQILTQGDGLGFYTVGYNFLIGGFVTTYTSYEKVNGTWQTAVIITPYMSLLSSNSYGTVIVGMQTSQQMVSVGQRKPSSFSADTVPSPPWNAPGSSGYGYNYRSLSADCSTIATGYVDTEIVGPIYTGTGQPLVYKTNLVCNVTQALPPFTPPPLPTPPLEPPIPAPVLPPNPQPTSIVPVSPAITPGYLPSAQQPGEEPISPPTEQLNGGVVALLVFSLLFFIMILVGMICMFYRFCCLKKGGVMLPLLGNSISNKKPQ